MDSKCSPTLATLAWRHIPISIWRSRDCAWYQGWRPNGSVAGRIHRGSLSVTANSGDSQSISVYGLKFRRTDPSDSVASISTYSASSATSMLRRHRRTMRVLSIRSLPTEVCVRTGIEHGTAGTGNYPDPWRHYDPATSQGLHVSLFTLRACAGRLSFRSSRRGSVPLTTLMAWPTSSPPPGNSHRHQTPRRPLWVGPVEGPA